MTINEAVPQPPTMRKLWVVVTLTILVLTFPIAFIILVSGPIYRWRDHAWHPISNGARFTYAGLLGLWLVAVIAKAVITPGSVSQEWAKSDNTDQPIAQTASAPDKASAADKANQPSQTDAGLSACTSSMAIESVKNVLNGMDEVLDFGKEQETWFDPANNQRRCAAMAALKSGQSIITYQIYYGPSGKELVQVQTGDKAFMQHQVDMARKEEAELQAKKSAPAPADPDTNVKADNYEDAPASNQDSAPPQPEQSPNR